MDAQAAAELGLHIGSTARLGFYSDAELLSPACCTANTPPQVTVDLHLVGIVVFPNALVQDEIDNLNSHVKDSGRWIHH
jgi:hypothetical protein